MEFRIKREAEQYGPYSLAEVRTYLADGHVTPEDLASTDGVTWRPLRHLLADVDGRPPVRRRPARWPGGSRPHGARAVAPAGALRRRHDRQWRDAAGRRGDRGR